MRVRDVYWCRNVFVHTTAVGRSVGTDVRSTRRFAGRRRERRTRARRRRRADETRIVSRRVDASGVATRWTRATTRANSRRDATRRRTGARRRRATDAGRGFGCGETTATTTDARGGGRGIWTARAARSGGIWEGGGKATRDARRDGEGVARALDFDDDDGGWEGAAASTTTSYESSTSRLRSARGDDDVAVFDEEAARDEAAEAEAEDDEARGALRGALDAVDLASRNAISRRFDVESVKELARECARARRAAGVRDLRFVDDADDELARESRLEEARAKCRAKVAEAEADFLRREAEEAKEKYISRYGDAGRAWVASLSARVDEWHADCAQKLTTVATSPRYADVDSSGAATLAATKWLHLLDASPTKRRRSLAARED